MTTKLDAESAKWLLDGFKAVLADTLLGGEIEPAPRVQADVAHVGHVAGRAVSITIDGHERPTGICVDADVEGSLETVRRVVAAWNATRHLPVEDLEKLGG